MNASKLIVYHRTDMDGVLSGYIARKAIQGTDIRYLDYNYEPITGPEIEKSMPNLKEMYILDCSLPVDTVTYLLKKGVEVVWCDHHITAIKDAGETYLGYLNHKSMCNTEESGCMLTWKYFHKEKKPPKIVKLVNIYDTWDTDNVWWDQADAINCFLMVNQYRVMDPRWDYLFTNSVTLTKFINKGKDYLQAVGAFNNRIANRFGGTLTWEGVKFYMLNSSGNSQKASNVPNDLDHEAILLYRYDPNIRRWKISLYNSSHLKAKPDLSVIACKFEDGGGHKGACGFTCEELPFNIKEIRPLWE